MMNMQSRNQYIKEIRKEYLKIRTKKERGKLSEKREKRTGLNRKYLMEKLKPKSNIEKDKSQRKKQKQLYDNSIKPAMIQMWHTFDQPCGQRLKTLLKDEIERLRMLGELNCSDKTATKLKVIGSAAIDRKLKHQKEVERMKRKYKRKMHPLLYKKVPVKVFEEQNRQRLGNVQIDLVEHCGASVAGEFINTLSSTDISSGWWEGEAIMGRGQKPTQQGLDWARTSSPFLWQEIHSDNGIEFINAHLFKYSQTEKIGFSRSRPYKKNDNCLIEQKNWTHVKKFVGYSRYDTEAELKILNNLYRNELRLYKNFFQPVIKLISKERIGGKIHRKYDNSKTPYQKIMESEDILENKKQELKKIYQSLNPAELKRTIDKKLDMLYKTYQNKNKSQKVDVDKKLKDVSVRSSKLT